MDFSIDDRRKIATSRKHLSHRSLCLASHLNDFEVSIFPFGLSMESEDRSQEAEKVSGPRGMLERELFEA